MGRPPGRELALFVSDVLTEARLPHQGPLDREGWAWTLQAQQDFTHVEIIVGFTDDDPRQWLITMEGHVSLARGLAIGGNADEARDAALRPFCLALDRALKYDPRFNEIRWYSVEEFDTNHGDTWADSP